VLIARTFFALASGLVNGVVLHRELVALGFSGSYQQVQRCFQFTSGPRCSMNSMYGYSSSAKIAA